MTGDLFRFCLCYHGIKKSKEVHTMRNDLTELVFILDRSGSMYNLVSDTIGGFNSVLESNRSQPGEANVTTILFNDHVTLLHDRQPIKSVAPITNEDYCVRGSTALLDAIGQAIRKIDNVQKHTAEPYRAGKVQFVIITDGLENASREYSLPRIRQLIDHYRKEHCWDFLFLGSNMDAISVASSMGIDPDRAVTAMADKQGVGLQYEAVAQANIAYRSGHAPTAAWKHLVEKDAQARGGHHNNHR